MRRTGRDSQLRALQVHRAGREKSLQVHRTDSQRNCLREQESAESSQGVRGVNYAGVDRHDPQKYKDVI